MRAATCATRLLHVLPAENLHVIEFVDMSTEIEQIEYRKERHTFRTQDIEMQQIKNPCFAQHNS